MKSTGIYYSSLTGNTADAARRIAAAMCLDPSTARDVAEADPVEIASHDLIILGTGTARDGNMDPAMADATKALGAMDLRGKRIALFGTGDETMATSFCDGVGRLYDAVSGTGATMVGAYSVAPFSVERSLAVREPGMAVGLLLDYSRPEAFTDSRIEEWVMTLA